MISVTDDPDAANDQFEVGSVTFFSPPWFSGLR